VCGITGIWSYNQPDISDSEMDIFTDTLAHRGPDGRGTYHDEGCNFRLGHRRLAILDLSDAGHQPMSSADKRFWIVYNGEIYNYIELREELEALGHTFTSHSDTEVLLASYIQWGEECQLKFNGMWAFAIWDTHTRTLFLSRDRFGIKPLYYIVNDRFFSFASEMKGFLALKCYNYGFDTKNILNARKLEGTDACPLQGVKRLIGGHCLTIGSKRIPEITKWWNTLDHLVQVPETFEKQMEKFRELFFEACRIRMRSDVSIGTSLSGGLDSSAVLAAIHKIGHVEGFTTDWQKAFVACYPETRLDESHYARVMIEATGASPVYTNIEYEVVKEHIQDLVYQYEGIDLIPLEGAWLNYKAMRDNRVIVSLDGHGADELLAGYATIINTEKDYAVQHGKLLYYFHLRKVLKNLKGGSQPVQLSIRDDMIYFFASNFVSIGKKLMKMCSKNFWRDLSQGYSAELPDLTIQSHLNKTLYDYFHYQKLQTILRVFDRLSMAHGVEVRMPFMDWRLVTYAFSLPDNCKISNGYTKFILRAAMGSILPESIRLRTNKIGFSSPMTQFFESGLGDFILPIIKDCFHQYPYYYPKGDLVDDIQRYTAQKKWTELKSLWPTIQIYLFIDAFNKKRESLLSL
jgi:asparagine synthase (glutamine-hydrolysing)